MAAPPRTLHSSTDSYTLESVLGQGASGIVAKYRRTSDSRLVAIKMMEACLIQAANTEISVLENLRRFDPYDTCNWVRWSQAFQHMSYTCLEFQCLDKSLFDLMRETGFQPVHLEHIRPILQQVAVGLFHLKSLNVVHGDLKLENVMLVNQRQQPHRVKVIDFGLAHHLSNARPGKCIQTLPFRAPEVMLAVPYTTAVDVWSLGCMAAFLYLGCYLYCGYTEYEMLRNVVETQGLPPDTVLDRGYFTNQYFTKDACSGQSSWRLKTVEEFYEMQACQFPQNNCMLASLDDLLHFRQIITRDQQSHRDQTSDVQMFVDLVKGMLQLDPAKRLTPHEVLQHPFISLSHFSMDPPSSYASSCLKTMEVCCGVNREAAQPVKRNPPTCSDHGAPVKHGPTLLRASISSRLASNHQRTSKHHRASDKAKGARMGQLRHRRKTRAAQSSSCSSQSGTSFTLHQDDLRLTLQRKRKSPDDTSPEPDKKRRRIMMHHHLPQRV